MKNPEKKQVLKWAVSEAKMIASSPLADLKLTRGSRRETLVNVEQHRMIARPRFIWSVDATGRRVEYNPKAESSLRMLLWFAWWTGARPGELRQLNWEHVDDDYSRAVLRTHETASAIGRARDLLQPVGCLDSTKPSQALWRSVYDVES